MKFQKGDLIVCIRKNDEDWLCDSELIIGKKYTIDRITINISIKNGKIVYLKEKSYPYLLDRFVLLNEYRLMKLKKLKNEIQSRRQSNMC